MPSSRFAQPDCGEPHAAADWRAKLGTAGDVQSRFGARESECAFAGAARDSAGYRGRLSAHAVGFAIYSEARSLGVFDLRSRACEFQSWRLRPLARQLRANCDDGQTFGAGAEFLLL